MSVLVDEDALACSVGFKEIDPSGQRGPAMSASAGAAFLTGIKARGQPFLHPAPIKGETT
jgi:hypothetical protein